MSTLVIDVDDTERNVREQFTFDASPVRIGRSQLNELPLPFDFVSHCHGILTFRPGHCEYVDLGSTNGTFVAGERILKNKPHALSPRTTLSIGKLKLTARQTSERMLSRTSYAFDTQSVLSEAEARVVAVSLPPLPSDAPPRATAAQLTALYAAYRESWSALHSSLAVTYRALEPGAREAWISQTLRSFPDLPQEAEFRAMVSAETTAPPSGNIVRVIARLTGEDGRDLSRTPPAELEQQVVTLLERCMQTFVELRDGHDHFMAEMGLRAPHKEPGALSGITTASGALRYFLGTGVAPTRLEELARAYTDIMTHQVALLNAVIAGARELLGRLEGSALAPRPSPFPRWLSWLVGPRVQWAARQKLLDDLRDEGALTAALFGRAFARTYAASIGQRGSAPGGSAESIMPREGP
ncbi:MAG: FHA domain-containing protein [Polyangiales bacterium]